MDGTHYTHILLVAEGNQHPVSHGGPFQGIIRLPLQPERDYHLDEGIGRHNPAK
jgi:hypothetical protein